MNAGEEHELIVLRHKSTRIDEFFKIMHRELSHVKNDQYFDAVSRACSQLDAIFQQIDGYNTPACRCACRSEES